MSRQLFCDLHIHSCFSIASSERMLPDGLIEGCRKKGIQVLGSGDALHAGWRNLWSGARIDAPVLVIPTAEVEDRDRVHHLIILDSFERFEDLAGDLNPHAKNLAEKNLAKLGLSERITFKNRDIQEGFDETNVDALFLDVQNPYDFLSQARRALKPGGFFGSLLPTANQVTQLIAALERHDFAYIDVCEILLRYCSRQAHLVLIRLEE